MINKNIKKIYHIDCTLRDGGYYTNWNFKKNLVNQYLEAMNAINVDYVEIGFRFIDVKKNRQQLNNNNQRRCLLFFLLLFILMTFDFLLQKNI